MTARLAKGRKCAYEYVFTAILTRTTYGGIRVPFVQDILNGGKAEIWQYHLQKVKQKRIL